MNDDCRKRSKRQFAARRSRSAASDGVDGSSRLRLTTLTLLDLRNSQFQKNLSIFRFNLCLILWAVGYFSKFFEAFVRLTVSFRL
jgi:hypothetical protein